MRKKIYIAHIAQMLAALNEKDLKQIYTVARIKFTNRNKGHLKESS